MHKAASTGATNKRGKQKLTTTKAALSLMQINDFEAKKKVYTRTSAGSPVLQMVNRTLSGEVCRK